MERHAVMLQHSLAQGGPLSPLMRQLLNQLRQGEQRVAEGRGAVSQASSVLLAENSQLRERVSHKLLSYDKMQASNRHLNLYGRSPAKSPQSHQYPAARDGRRLPPDHQHHSFSGDARQMKRSAKIPEDLLHVMEPDDIFASKKGNKRTQKVTSISFDRSAGETYGQQPEALQQDKICRLTQIIEIEQDHVSERRGESARGEPEPASYPERDDEQRVASALRRYSPLISGLDQQAAPNLRSDLIVNKSALSQSRRYAASPLSSNKSRPEYMSYSKKTKQQQAGNQPSNKRQKSQLQANDFDLEAALQDQRGTGAPVAEVPQPNAKFNLRDQTGAKTISGTSTKNLLTRGEAIGQERLVAGESKNQHAVSPPHSSMKRGENTTLRPSAEDDADDIVIQESNNDQPQGHTSPSTAQKLKAVRLKGPLEPGLRMMNAESIIQNNIDAMQEGSQQRAEGMPRQTSEEELYRNLQGSALDQSRRRAVNDVQFQQLEMRHFGFDQIKRRYGVFYAQHLGTAKMQTPTSALGQENHANLEREGLRAHNPNSPRQPHFEKLNLPAIIDKRVQPTLKANRSKDKPSKVLARPKAKAPKNYLNELGKQIYNDRLLIRKRMEQVNLEQFDLLQHQERSMQASIKQSLEKYAQGLALTPAPSTPFKYLPSDRSLPQNLSMDMQAFKNQQQLQVRASSNNGAEVLQAIHTHEATQDSDSKGNLEASLSPKSIKSPPTRETGDDLRPWMDASESGNENPGSKQEKKKPSPKKSKKLTIIQPLRPGGNKSPAENSAAKYVSIQNSEQVSNLQSNNSKLQLNERFSQDRKANISIETQLAKRITADEQRLEDELENQKLQMQLQLQHVGRKKIILQQERAHSTYVKSKQFKVLGGKILQKNEKKEPASIRLSVNVGPLLDRKHDLFQRSKEAVAVAGTKINQKGRYAELLSEQEKNGNVGDLKQAMTMSQESAGKLVEVARSRMLPRTEDASLLDEGSHTVETDLQENDTIRESKAMSPSTSYCQLDLRQETSGQRQSPGNPRPSQNSFEKSNNLSLATLKHKKNGSKMSKLLNKGRSPKKSKESSARGLLEQYQDDGVQRQLSRQQVLSRINNANQFYEQVQLLRTDSSPQQNLRLSQSKVRQLQMLRQLANQIKEDHQDKSQLQTLEASMSKQSLLLAQEVQKTRSTRAAGAARSLRKLNFQEILNHSSPEHAAQALLQGPPSVDKSPRFHVNYLSKRPGALQSLTMDKGKDQQPQGVDGRRINLRNHARMQKGGVAPAENRRKAAAPKVELMVQGLQKQRNQESTLSQEETSPIVCLEEVGTSPLVQGHLLSTSESPAKTSEHSLNFEAAKGFELSPKKIRSILTTQEASTSEPIAKGEHSNAPNEEVVEKNTMKEAGLDAKDKRINFENLDINTPRESLRNRPTFPNLKDQAKTRSKDKQKSVAFEQSFELKKMELAQEEEAQAVDAMKSPFKNARIDRELAQNNKYTKRIIEEIQIEDLKTEKKQLQESVAATPSIQTPHKATVIANKAQLQLIMGAGGYKAKRHIYEQPRHKTDQDQQVATSLPRKEEATTPGKRAGQEMQIVSSKIQLETQKGKQKQKQTSEIRVKMPTDMSFQRGQRAQQAPSIGTKARRPPQTEVAQQYFAQIPGQAPVTVSASPRPPLANMNSDSILNSMAYMRKRYQTIGRNVSLSVNQGMLPRSDDSGEMLIAQINKTLAKTRLQPPALSSETQSYDSALTNDINEARRQQMRIQDVIQQQSARRYHNALSMSMEHASTLDQLREAPTIRVQNLNPNPSLGGHSPRTLATISAKKQPQQRHFKNPKKERIQVFASVDQMGNHPNKRLDNIVDGKIRGWDTALKDDDTVIIQIQGAKLLNEANIREMNNSSSLRPSPLEVEDGNPPSKLERIVKMQAPQKRSRADNYRGQQQINYERALQGGMVNPSLQLPARSALKMSDGADSPRSQARSNSQQPGDQLKNIGIENSIHVNIIKPQPSPASQRKMSGARKLKQEEERLVLENGTKSDLAANIRSSNADLKELTAYRESASREQEDDARMTNKFGQTLAKMAPSSPLESAVSPTAWKQHQANETNRQQIPQVTKVKIQNAVSPLNLSPNSKHRLVGCLPPLTESVHSFYKDTTFNSFRNIPNTTGSIQGGDVPQVLTHESQDLGGVQGIGINHEYVKELEKPTKIVVNYSKDTKGATSLQSKRTNKPTAIDPSRAIATSVEMNYMHSFKHDNDAFNLHTVPHDQLDRASMVNVGTVSGRSPSSHYQKGSQDNAFPRPQEAQAASSSNDSKQE